MRYQTEEFAEILGVYASQHWPRGQWGVRLELNVRGHTRAASLSDALSVVNDECISGMSQPRNFDCLLGFTVRYWVA
jgi:hypothetical protein